MTLASCNWVRNVLFSRPKINASLRQGFAVCWLVEALPASRPWGLATGEQVILLVLDSLDPEVNSDRKWDFQCDSTRLGMLIQLHY